MTRYPVIWSPRAKISYYSILEYLDKEWTYREIEAFVSRTEEAIGHMIINPYLFPYSSQGDAHKCVLVKQVSLFYRIKNDSIELLVFFDNRQDPAKLLL